MTLESALETFIILWLIFNKGNQDYILRFSKYEQGYMSNTYLWRNKEQWYDRIGQLLPVPIGELFSDFIENTYSAFSDIYHLGDTILIISISTLISTNNNIIDPWRLIIILIIIASGFELYYSRYLVRNKPW